MHVDEKKNSKYDYNGKQKVTQIIPLIIYLVTVLERALNYQIINVFFFFK